MQTELDQHAKLHRDLEALSSAIEGWKAETSTYNSDKLQSLLEQMGPNFRTHLKEEVDSLSRYRLVDKVTSQELKDCINKLEEEVKKGDPFIAPIFMMSHTPPEHKVSGNLTAFFLSPCSYIASRFNSTGQIWAGSCIESSFLHCPIATQGQLAFSRSTRSLSE